MQFHSFRDKNKDGAIDKAHAQGKLEKVYFHQYRDKSKDGAIEKQEIKVSWARGNSNNSGIRSKMAPLTNT